jgi:hypothetical protein
MENKRDEQLFIGIVQDQTKKFCLLLGLLNFEFQVALLGNGDGIL